MVDMEDQNYKAGWLAGKEHRLASPETKSFMNEINMEIKHIKEDLKDIKNNMVTSDKMELANEHLVERIFNKVQSEYVCKTEFDPVKKVVYWTIGIGGTAVVSSIVYSILK